MAIVIRNTVCSPASNRNISAEKPKKPEPGSFLYDLQKALEEPWEAVSKSAEEPKKPEPGSFLYDLQKALQHDVD